MTSTSNPPRHIRRLRQARREVAAEAARIIATEGQPNYHAAKKKAAERIGVSERLALPSNVEVREALHAYQSLYGGDRHQDNLEKLRNAAVGAMRMLQNYNPRLVGPVLDGTANEHSRVSLHVFCDAPEELVLHFIENRLPYTQEQRQIRWHDGNYRTLPIIVIEHDHASIELTVFQPVQLRQAPPSPIDGKPQERATLADVEFLLAAASLTA